MGKVTTAMAQTARKSWQERAEVWRDKINTSKIINRFQEFVLGAIAPEGFVVLPLEPTEKMLSAAGINQSAYQAMIEQAPKSAPVIMTPAQVKAGQVLLDRVMPTLSASEVTRKTDNVSPQELIQQLRDRYGDEFANKIAKDYKPVTHDAPSQEQ